METLASRLDACQDQMLELYETDSNKLSDQIKHWRLARLESAMLYKAREAGLSRIGHQAVPSLAIAKAKAHKAIEVQLALEQLQTSAYATEQWTLQDTSQEMWDTEPKRCWKKNGQNVEVRYDGEEGKAMIYVLWKDIYVQRYSDNVWTKVKGQISYEGLYYVVENVRTYYCKFAKDALLYGNSKAWEVHFAGKVIYHCNFDPVSSTHSPTDALPSAGLGLPHPSPPPTSCIDGCAQKEEGPVPKRQRLDSNGHGLQQPDSTQEASALLGDRGPRLDPGHNTDQCDSGIPVTCRATSNSDSSPVIHLRGDPNALKCLRYRLQQTRKSLFVKISSTWRWACGERHNSAYVTIWYSSEEQRSQFLNVVKIPPGMHAALGSMTAFA
ncbi:E2 [Macaca fuscata papillomavirus 2]|uniref:Regulatory protein E2 n=1 Tax=Macaca fuscata papillomavirus 2 TaxID=2506204 RepID=A0A451G308_9PAPI|nr:E2 [Macaca fuscata papillomavirus 2]